MENENKVIPQDKALEVFKGLSEKITVNRPLIKQKSGLAIAALKAIVSIKNDADDKKANDLLVKCNATKTAIEKLRKDFTGPIKQWCDEQIITEKELESEMERVRTLRNARANELKAANDEKEKEIEKERVYKTHEIEVKQKIKSSIEIGVAQKISDLEDAIAKIFKSMDLNNRNASISKLNFTPKLKEDYFATLFVASFDSDKMTDEQYESVLNRARGYYKYEDINKGYVDLANSILKKWKDQIPARLKELEEIGKGNTTLAMQAIARDEAEEQERKETASQKIEEIKTEALEVAQEEIIQAEFSAQQQLQEIDEVPGRKKITLRLTAEIEKDMVKVSSLVAKLVIHALSHSTSKGIFMRDAQGFPKHDDKGRPLYVAGIQYWLDKMEDTGYASMIEGLVKTEEVVTVARK